MGCFIGICVYTHIETLCDYFYTGYTVGLLKSEKHISSAALL